MPTRTGLLTLLNPPKDQVYTASWSGLLNGDDGTAIELGAFSDRSVQFSGTFGVGGTLELRGSNDGTNYVVLTDPQGNSISKTSAAIEMVTELTRYIKPVVTAGDGTTNLVCTVILKKVE